MLRGVALATEALCELRLLVTGNVVLSMTIIVTLMMEAIRSSETSALTRATQRNSQKTTFLKMYLGCDSTAPTKITAQSSRTEQDIYVYLHLA
jgi:hypothetical protein